MKPIVSKWSDKEIAQLEAEYPQGVSVQQITELCVARGHRITEATFRKYVQLGLLPRSVRVGQKGKRRGSRGLYPVAAIRQLEHLRGLMALGFTIEEIQQEFLFVSGDIAAVERQIERVVEAFQTAMQKRGVDDLANKELEAVQTLGKSLIEKLRGIEARLSAQARMSRAAL